MTKRLLDTVRGVGAVHDFLMQTSVTWRTAIGRGYSLTLSGAPVGEPALGPVTFMNWERPSDDPDLGTRLAQEYKIGTKEQLTSCSTCHR